MIPNITEILNKSAKTEAQTIPGNPDYEPVGPIEMVCQLPDVLSFDATVGQNFSFPVYVAFRHMGDDFPYLPHIKIRSSVYVNPANPLDPNDGDCGDGNNPFVRRTSPCTFESNLTEDNFPHNGAGWRVHKRDVNFELGPDCVPYDLGFPYFTLAWKMEAFFDTYPPPLPGEDPRFVDTRIIVLQKDRPFGPYFLGMGYDKPATTMNSWKLLPSCPNTPDDPRIGIKPMRPTTREFDPLSTSDNVY